MDFVKNRLYTCLHDCIIGTEIAFTKGNIYKCINNNSLLGNNKKKYDLVDAVKWKYYFKQTDDCNVNHPKHYTWIKELCGIEPIDIIRHMDFDLGNAIKYIIRAGKKPLIEDGLADSYTAAAIQDLKKAVFYINDKIKQLEGKV